MNERRGLLQQFRQRSDVASFHLKVGVKATHQPPVTAVAVQSVAEPTEQQRASAAAAAAAAAGATTSAAAAAAASRRLLRHDVVHQTTHPRLIRLLHLHRRTKQS